MVLSEREQQRELWLDLQAGREVLWICLTIVTEGAKLRGSKAAVEGLH